MFAQLGLFNDILSRWLFIYATEAKNTHTSETVIITHEGPQSYPLKVPYCSISASCIHKTYILRCNNS